MSPALSDSPATLAITGTRLDGRDVDVLIHGSRIAAIHATGGAPEQVAAALRRVDGRRTAVLPGLANAHTHSAMAIMRGLADDMALMPWLNEKIWPFEAHLTEEDVYWGARLACVEMIRTGTTFFNDMYWFFHGTARAAVDSGLRCQLAGAMIDLGDPARAEAAKDEHQALREAAASYGSRVSFALAPHAVYTVSEDLLGWVRDEAERYQLPIHMHLSETQVEVDGCLASTGLRPVHYLDRLGLLGPRFLGAHAVHLTDDEIGILAARGAHVLHNPTSNLKLASGGPMRYADLRAAGVNVLVGTDGCASNNNLDLLEELKFAALMAKHATGDPTVMPAQEALDLVTTHAARAFDQDIGRVAPGALADLILVDLDHPLMFPGHNLSADLVYSALGRAVKTTVCDGRVLLEGGLVADEAEIRTEVSARLARLLMAAGLA